MTDSGRIVTAADARVQGARDAAPTSAAEQSAGEQSAGERSGSARLRGIDLARGLAILGMMAIHLLPEATGDGDPTWTWLTFGGRSAALFALLAGFSLSFMSGGRRGVTKDTWARSGLSIATRALLITVIGLVLGQISVEISVILTYYGLLFLIVIPLLALRPLALALLGLFAAVAGPVLMFLALPYAPEASITTEDPSLSWLATPGALLWDLFVTGVYPVPVWAAYVLVGLAAGRLVSVRSPRFAARLFIGGLTLALVAWFSAQFLAGVVGGAEGLAELTPGLDADEARDIGIWGFDEVLPTSSWWWLTIVAPHSSTPFDVLHTLGSALAVLGLCLLIMRKERPGARLIITAGTMPLSIYTLHVLMTELVFRDLVHPWVSLIAQLAILGVFAWAWSRKFGQGPLELVLATCTKAVVGRLVPRRTAVATSGTDRDRVAEK